MADRQGFEPWRQSPAYTLSKRAPSTTRPPVLMFCPSLPDYPTKRNLPRAAAIKKLAIPRDIG